MAYTKSNKVKQYETDYYDYLNNSNPGEFSSDYSEAKKTALDNYINHGDFSYNPATDSSYQAARKQYTTSGKQAMKDTLGTATELTGGYNNSYAQTAAQQTYNDYMSQLASLMPDYETAAYNRWKDDRSAKYDYYTVLKDAETADYNKHRDSVTDYYTHLGQLYDNYTNELTHDFTAYQEDMDNYQWAEELAATIANNDEENAIERIKAEAYAENLLSTEPETNTSLYDYAGRDNNGKAVFYKDGKKYTFDAGINPYTSTVNRDVKNGAKVTSTGYQPLQIGVYEGNKLIDWLDLTKTGETDVVNGRTQNIWKTPDGTKYIWDGSLNTYRIYQED